MVTVNDYLAKRDAEDIGRIHRFMGLSVGCILKSTSQEEKKKEYAKDISLVGYGQKDPAIVYKLKAFDMFNKMSDDIKNDAVYTLFSSRLRTAAPKRDTAA